MAKQSGYFSVLIKDIFRPKDVCATLQPVIFVTTLFGVTPIRITGSPGKRRILSSIFLLLSISFRIITYTYLSVEAIRNNKSVVQSFLQSNISKIGDYLQKVYGIVVISVSLSIVCLKRHKLIKCIGLFGVIEKRIEGVGILINHNRAVTISRWYAFWLFVASVGVVGVNHIGLLVRTDIRSSFAANIAFFGPSITTSAIAAMYLCITRTLEAQLWYMNKVLKNLSNQWENRKIRSISAKSRSLNCIDSFFRYTIVTKNPSEIIHESMEIHHLICEAASTANKYFTYQLLTIISIAFLIIVFDAYYVLETLLGKSKRESKFKTVEFVTFFSCQMFLYLIAIISIVEGSNRAIKKSEKTGGIVHSLLNKAKNPDVKEKLQQFSMQLIHLKINFTAAGLFNIDRTLYFIISGALTTYLIILLQFTSSTPNIRTPCLLMPNVTNGTIPGLGN